MKSEFSRCGDFFCFFQGMALQVQFSSCLHAARRPTQNQQNVANFAAVFVQAAGHSHSGGLLWWPLASSCSCCSRRQLIKLHASGNRFRIKSRGSASHSIHVLSTSELTSARAPALHQPTAPRQQWPTSRMPLSSLSTSRRVSPTHLFVSNGFLAGNVTTDHGYNGS